MKEINSRLKARRGANGITREQIAQAAGASPAAVSSFYNDRYYAKDRRHAIGLSQRTCQRILDASRALGYQPADPSWRVRLYPETGDFCFLLSQGAGDGFANEYFSRMVTGVMRRLAGPPPRHLVCAQFDDNVDYLTNEDALPACIRAGTTSRYLLAGSPNYSLLAVLARSGFPVVYLSRYVALPGVCSVVPDFADASRQVVEHLAGLGHRHIAVVSPHYINRPSGWNALEFTRGLSEAMAAAGLPFDPARDVLELLAHAPAGATASTDRVLADLTARQPVPTAVFCLDDWAAMELLRAARNAGLDVPGRLSIVGCNNIQGTASLHPSLTTVNIPGEQMGATGFDEVEAMLRAGGGSPEPRQITQAVELIKRESSAPPGGR